MPVKKKPLVKQIATRTPETSGEISPELSLIRSLAAILNETGLTEIELDHKGARVRVSRSVTVAASVAAAPLASHHVAVPAAVPMTAAIVPTGDHPGTLKSPMVGTCYLAPSPGAADFVAVGSSVKLGQPVLIIEAMKTMNQIVAHRAGKVIQIIVENGSPVEFGQPLLVIE
jgi:acetyl-CoA carboxylase biotin carboxyl carrier protein